MTAAPRLSLLIWVSFVVPAQGPNRMSGMALPAQILAALDILVRLGVPGEADKNVRAPGECEIRAQRAGGLSQHCSLALLPRSDGVRLVGRVRRWHVGVDPLAPVMQQLPERGRLLRHLRGEVVLLTQAHPQVGWHSFTRYSAPACFFCFFLPPFLLAGWSPSPGLSA